MVTFAWRTILFSTLLILLAGPVPAVFPDVIIMKDGSVLECKIKETKLPDAKNPNNFIVVAEVDEKGTIKQIMSKDIKREGTDWLIYKGKTTWEKRAEYSKEYEKKAEAIKAKDTWDVRQSLGKWCKTHLLGEKAEEQYKLAYKMRSEQTDAWLKEGKLKDPIEQHIKLGKWCEKDLGLFTEGQGEFMKAYQLKKEAMKEDTAAAHVTLARWCEQSELSDQAVVEYEAALKIDEKNSTAKAALDKIKNSIDFKLKRLAAEYDKVARAWHFTVAIEEKVDRKFLDEWAKKIQDLSDYIWVITEGQCYIADCEIENNTSQGKIIVEKGKLDWYGLSNKQGSGTLAYCQGSGTPHWEVHAPGKAAISVLAHECFHGVFGLPDEYYQNPQCDCVMRSAPNPQKLCDDGNHIGGGANRPGPPGSEGKDCWQIIKNRKEFKSTIVHPNPKWHAAEAAPKQKSPPNRGDYTDGSRAAPGELEWGSMRLKTSPKTTIRIVE